MTHNLNRYFLLAAVIAIFLSGCSTMNANGLKITGEGMMQAGSSPLVWQQVRSPLFSSAEDAENYVKTLDLGGFTDWRLPTSEELLDFYFAFDFGNAGTTADDLGLRVEGNYWFKDAEGSLQTGAWKDDGGICEITRGYRRSESGYVRAVRP